MCHIVLPQPSSVHDNALNCSLCHRSLFKTAIDNALDTLTTLNEKLVNQKNHSELLLAENHSLRHTIALLEAQLGVLRQDNDVIGKKLISEAERRGQLLLENDLILQELNELTERVFSEANAQVSAEARKRFEEEALRARILRELDETKKQREVDQEQLRDLKEKIGHFASSVTAIDHHRQQTQEFDEDRIADCMELEFLFALNHGVGENCSTEEGAARAGEVSMVPVGGESSASPSSLDPELFAEFQHFLHEYQRAPSRLNSLPFMRRCIQEDFVPCLKGLGWMTCRRVLEAFCENTCFVEPAAWTYLRHHQTPPESEGACAACDQKRICPYQFKLRPGDTWKPLDPFCRERLAAVGNLYAFLRAWRSGSSKTEVELFQTCHRLRAKIFLARSGLTSSFSGAMMVVAAEEEVTKDSTPEAAELPTPDSPFASFLTRSRKSATHLWSIAKELPHHLEVPPR